MTIERQREAEAAPPSRTIQIGRTNSVENVERMIYDLTQGPEEDSVDVKLPTNPDGSVLGDVWANIFLGTLARRSATRVIGWGLSEITAQSTIASTPAFLSALSMASTVAPEHGANANSAEIRKHFSITQKGLVDPTSGAAKTLVEFDPDFSVAPMLRGGSGFAAVTPLERKRIFENLVLRFRHALEISAIRHGVTPSKSGPAGDLGRFLTELHENAYEHGSRDSSGKMLRGTRLLRLKKRAANSKDILVQRCAGMPGLAEHVQQSIPKGSATPALVEASVSDFGLGMVDGFRLSDAGRNIRTENRRELLEALIYERLSSKGSDPSAGLGIQKALDAARRMGAFVSLRTAEFWLTVSFASSDAVPRLTDASPEPCGKVAGTHWQILWAQP